MQGYLKGTRPRYCWSASIDTQGTVALHARFAPISIQAELLSGCAPFSWHKCIDPALIAKGSNLWLQSPLVAKEGFCETRRLAAGRMFSALCRWSHELCYYLGGVAVVIWRGGTGEQQLAASQVRCGHWGWLKPHCGPVAVCTVVLGGYVLTSDQQGTEPGHNSQRVSLCGRVRPACRDVHSVRWSGRTVPQRAVAQHGVACSAPSGTPWSSLRRGAVEASVLPCQQVTVFKRIIRTRLCFLTQVAFSTADSHMLMGGQLRIRLGLSPVQVDHTVGPRHSQLVTRSVVLSANWVARCVTGLCIHKDVSGA